MTRTIGLILTLLIILCLFLTPVQANGSKPSVSRHDSQIDIPPHQTPLSELPDFNSLPLANVGSNCSTSNINSGSSLIGTSNLTSSATSGIPHSWGNNNYGQLGDGTLHNGTSVPVQTTGLNSVIAIAGGDWHGLALKSDGSVWAWGNNEFYQLGNQSGKISSVPVQVSGLNNVTAVAAGYDYSLALKSDGTVWSWGWPSSVPTQASGLSGVIAIAGGEDHKLVLKSDGTVWAWGWNGEGELGNGSTNYSYVPVQVSGLSGVTAIAGGQRHSLALKSDGTVWAWGYNSSGQLGNGSTVDSLVPVQVTSLSNVTAIAGGYYHSLALKSDTSVWAWGYNGVGQVGNGSNYNINISVPVQVTSLGGVTAIAGGERHSLALKSDGTVWAWGENGSGQLGNGFYLNSSIPLRVISLSGVTAIAGGERYSLGLKSDGTVWGWGDKSKGQLGNGDVGNVFNPIPVINLTSSTALVGGYYHSLALKPDNTVWAWGDNEYGQLGNGTYNDSNVPVQVTGLNSVIAIGSGSFHGLALKSNGTVWVWGRKGNLANLVPVQVTDLSSVTAIAAGGSHNLALKSDGTIWAWGENHFGQLGNGSNTFSSMPVQVTGLNNVVTIAARGEHSLAVKSDGTVWAWGLNQYGQLGNGSIVNSLVPVQVNSLGNVTAIAGGLHHNLALKSDGTVWAWGYNNHGQLGNGTTNDSYVPAQVFGLTNTCYISAGNEHSLAITLDGLPAAPNLTSPADGATVSTTSVTFQWETSSGATNYWLAVTKASDNSIMVSKAVGNVTSDTESGFPNDGTTYKWVVAAGNSAGWSSASTMRTFTNGTAVIIPTSPILISPADGATVSGSSVTFQWADSNGATNYWLAVIKASDNTVIINKAIGNVTSDAEIGFPNDGMTYKWVVAAGNSAGWSSASPIRTFTNGTAMTVPPAPTLTSPVDGATVTGNSVTFQWSASTGATNYWLAVVKASDNSVIINKAVGNVTSDTEAGFPNNGTQYKWVVAAGNSAGWGSASTIRTFINGTISVPPAPTLTSPVDGAKVSSTSVTFQWAASSGATNYWLAVVKASDNSVIVNKAVGNVTSDTEAGFPNNGTQYKWVVAAGNSAGWGSASASRIFTNGP
jgi:alpha-tubulin suppressor-like RCC1 family protein